MTSIAHISAQERPSNPARVGHKTLWFLGLTFALTLLLDLVLLWTVGYDSPAALIALNLQMLLPAASAIALYRYAFKDSPIHFCAYRDGPRWFFDYFLLFTLAYLAMTLLALNAPERAGVLNLVGTGLSFLGLVLLVVLRLTSGREAMARVGLAGGKWTTWLLGGLALVAFYTLETALNAWLGLGERVDVAALAARAGLPTAAFVLTATVQTLLVSPFLGLVTVLGEEYGWRWTLQNALTRLGKVKGILILGLIWGLWHAPVVAMGHNFPGRPVLGVLLMTLYSIGMAFVLGHVVLKTGNVLLAAFLHQLNNGFGAYLSTLWVTPNDPAFSFFAGGLYGLPLLLVVVLLLLRDPVWRD